MKRLTSLVFSPTGGTQKVTDILAEELMVELINYPDLQIVETAYLDLCERSFDFSLIELTEHDICLVSVPSYGGRVPKTAAERLSKIHGNGAQAILVAVYGNREFEDTLVELEDVLKAAGFKPVAGVAAIAEHSVVRDFAKGRPNAFDRRQLASFAKKIAVRLESIGAEGPAPFAKAPSLVLPGNRPYKEVNIAPTYGVPDDTCVNCGVCAAQCPVGAIDAADPSKVDETLCIACKRCIAVCPTHSRPLPEAVLEGSRKFLSEHIKEDKINQLF